MEELIEIIQNKFEDDFGKNDYTTGLNTAYKSVLAEIEIKELLKKEKKAIKDAYVSASPMMMAVETAKENSEEYYNETFK